MSRRAAPRPHTQRSKRQVEFVVEQHQIAFRLRFVFLYQLAHRHAAQIHVGFGLGQHDIFVADARPRRLGVAVAIVHHHTALFGNAVHRQKPQVVRCELVLDARIAEPDDQFHAAYFFFSAFSAFSCFSPPSAASPSASCLPFLMTSGSATAASASAPSTGAASTTSFTAVTWAIAWFSSVMNLILSLCGRSLTRSVCPNINWLTSPSRWLGMSAGKHSISTSRIICSRMPPCTFTPGASPFRCTGTLTTSFTFIAMRFRSTCSSAPLMGSACQSTIIALPESPPALRSKMVLCPASEARTRFICLGSTAMVSDSSPAPYSTAGMRPSWRRRRASFLLPPFRGLASIFFSWVAVAILSFPLQKQSADRRLFVNRLNSTRDQTRNRQLVDLGLFARWLAQRDGIGHNHFDQPRFRNSFDGRPRKHGMRGAGVDLLRTSVE